jgi:hypothetical protein
MTFEELRQWYVENQDPIPARIHTRSRLALNGLEDWSAEFTAWLTAPEAISVEEYADGRKVVRDVWYAYPMRRAIEIAGRSRVDARLPNYASFLRTFAACQYDIAQLASAYAAQFPLMGAPELAQKHLHAALLRCYRAHRFDSSR